MRVRCTRADQVRRAVEVVTTFSNQFSAVGYQQSEISNYKSEIADG
jgi:hypothetical protein